MRDWYYVVVAGRRYYHWDEQANEAVWQMSPARATRWDNRHDAEAVAVLYKEARVLLREV